MMPGHHALPTGAKEAHTARIGTGLAVDAVHQLEGCPMCAMGALLYGAAEIAETSGCGQELRALLEIMLLKLHKGTSQ